MYGLNSKVICNLECTCFVLCIIHVDGATSVQEPAPHTFDFPRTRLDCCFVLMAVNP